MTNISEFDDIWERVYTVVDFKEFKDAKNEKERMKLFKKALRKDPQTKNLLKMRRENFKHLFEYGLAQKKLEGDQRFIKRSFNRFGKAKQQRISHYQGALTKDLIRNIDVRGVSRRTVAKGQKVLINEKVYKGGQFLPNQKQ